MHKAWHAKLAYCNGSKVDTFCESMFHVVPLCTTLLSFICSRYVLLPLHASYRSWVQCH